MLSSSATAETHEQMKERTVVPLEVPHDTRICIEDLEDMEIDQLRDEEKKGKQPVNGTPEPVETVRSPLRVETCGMRRRERRSLRRI